MESIYDMATVRPGAFTRKILNRADQSIEDAVSSYNYGQVCDLFRDFKNFRSFARTVMSYVEPDNGSEEWNSEEAYKKLKALCEEKQVPVGDVLGKNPKETWRGWCQDAIPPRERGFALAFALSLSEEETRRFIRRAFFDRDFDPKDYRETIYYYCLANGYSWREAKELIDKFEKTEQVAFEEKSTEGNALFSHYLNKMAKEKTLREISEEELFARCAKIRNIAKSDHNANLKEQAKLWIEKAKKIAAEEINETEDMYSILPHSEESDIESRNSGRLDTVSNTALLNTIVGYSLYQQTNTRRASNSDLVFMDKLICRKFPTPKNLYDIEDGTCDNSKVLRNVIIMMASYCFWSEYRKKYEVDAERLYRGYIRQIDTILDRALAPHLYACDPLDCIYLVSSMAGEYSQLDNFRFLLEEAFSGAEILEKIARKEKEGSSPKKNKDNDPDEWKDQNSQLTETQKELLERSLRGDNEATEALAHTFFQNEEPDCNMAETIDSCWDIFYKNYLSKHGFKSNRSFASTDDKIANPLDSADNKIARKGMPSEPSTKDRANLSEYGANLYDLNDLTPLPMETIGLQICRDAIKQYDPNRGDLKKWILLKWHNIIDDYAHNYSQLKKIAGDKMKEYYNPDEKNIWFRNVLDHIKNEKDFKILKYRLGVDSQVYYKLSELQNVLKQNGVDADLDDVLLAEKRFIRLFRRYGLLNYEKVLSALSESYKTEGKTEELMDSY